MRLHARRRARPWTDRRSLTVTALAARPHGVAGPCRGAPQGGRPPAARPARTRAWSAPRARHGRVRVAGSTQPRGYRRYYRNTRGRSRPDADRDRDGRERHCRRGKGARPAHEAPGARVGEQLLLRGCAVPCRCRTASRGGLVSRPAGAMYALLTDGGTVEVRPARSQDFEAVRAMHAAMSPDNIYLRFFSMSPSAAEWEARRVCREPDSDHAALLAWQDGRLVGVGAYELAGKPGVAEVAFAVADDMHGRGIASLLLEHLVWRARQRGLQAFTGETLAENSAMLRMFADAGLPAKRRSRPAGEAADSRGHGRADLPAARRRRRLPAGPLPGGRGEQGKPGGRGEPAPAAAAAVGRRGGREPPSRHPGPGHLAQHRH